jgi:hypothetical protein
MSHCFLCGCATPHGCRQSTADLKSFTQLNCQATPFAYSMITETPSAQESSPLCIPCLNWKRRAVKKSRKTYLQVQLAVS